MDRLHEIEVFIAVAEAGSFIKAGNRLRLSPPAVTRAINALERRLGASVFNRTTRSLAITEVGRRFLERVSHIKEDLDEAEQVSVGETVLPQGHLSITASVTFGRLALSPIVCSFLGQHPRVTASLLLLDRLVNLVEEGIDIAVRIGSLPDSSLIARQVGTVRRMLVASPEYLARRGNPETPADLRQHSVIAFTGLMPYREWRFMTGSKTSGVNLQAALEVNDAAAAIQAAESGYGITLALSYMVSGQLAAGQLVQALEDFMPTPQPVHLVFPAARLAAPKTRAFIGYAAPRLKQVLEQMA